MHPLAAHPHQRRLELGQRQQLLRRQAGLAEHDFPLDIQHPVQGHAGLGLEARLGLGARRQLGAAFARPTGRQHHTEAVLLQQRRFLGEKAERPFGIQFIADRRRFLQTGFDRRTQRRRLPQGCEQAFPRLRTQGLQTLAGPPFRFPHRFGGNEQAGIFARLKQVVDSPLRLGVGEKRRVRILFVEPRFFQPKTQAIGRIDQSQQRSLPVANLLCQLPHFRFIAFQRTIGPPQRLNPLPMQTGRSRSGGSGRWERGRLPDHVIDEPGQEFPQYVAGRRVRERAMIRADGAGGGRHGPSQSFQTSAVLAQEYWRPAGSIGAPLLLY